MKTLGPLVFICCACTPSILTPSCCPNCPCNAHCKKAPTSAQKTKELVKQAYGKIAETDGACSCVGGCCGGGKDLSRYLGYTDAEIKELADANLGLGCGNPVMLGNIAPGSTVLDLGSGAGFDCMLAARRVGKSGHVIGVDMTPAMLKKARINAKKYGFTNVEFRKGDIEKLPVASNSVDIIISNCVINLAPNKLDVFREACRVLKPGGKMYVSDVVLLKPLTDAQRTDVKLLCACVSGALLKDDYINKLQSVGLDVHVVGQDTEIGKTWFNDTTLPIESLKFIATKK